MLKRLFGRDRTGKPEWEVGGLYSTRDAEMFRVVKLLILDEKAAHVRIFKPRYVNRPVHVEQRELTLGTIHDEDGFGMGHLPLSRSSFAQWQPVLIRVEPVDEAELDGYHEWREAKGGVWA